MFRTLVEESGLGETYFSNRTLFAPSNRAMREVPAEVLDGIKADRDRLEEFVGYHTAKPKTCKCDLDDNKLMESELEGKKLRYPADS